MPSAISSEEREEFGGRTVLADWMLDIEDLSAGAVALYARICYAAQQAACGGRELTLDARWADWASGGDGLAALQELTDARALTRIAKYKDGTVRFETEPYPPFIRDVMAGIRLRTDVPELNDRA